MSEQEKEINLKTDVALIQKDLKQIERFFNKFDTALQAMTDIAQKVAVQGEILKNTSEKLQNLESKITDHKRDDLVRSDALTDKLEGFRVAAYNDHERLAKETAQTSKERNVEIMAQLSKMNGSLDNKLEKLDDRLTNLENWKWYIMGLGAVVVFIAVNIKWTGLF